MLTVRIPFGTFLKLTLFERKTDKEIRCVDNVNRSQMMHVSDGLEVHEAAATGDADSLVEYLRTNKYDVNLKDADWNDRAALHWAAMRGFVECIRILLEHGADGSIRTDSGWTPAHYAGETGKLTVLRALHSAGVSLDLPDKYGDTPQDIAAIYGHQDCVQFLNNIAEEKEANKT